MEQERMENQQPKNPSEELVWETTGELRRKRLRKFVREWVVPFGLEILVLLFVIRFLFFFVIVPSGSMLPTIDKASVLFATRVHQPENLQRGDIVVFESDELDLTLVKRLVGLPGDHIDRKSVV